MTLCRGDNCPLRESCLRFTEEAHITSDWFYDSPYNFKLEECKWFEKEPEEVEDNQ